MSRVFWDTNLFIYLLEDSGPFTALTVPLAERMARRGDQLFTSTLTLGEVLVRPTRFGNEGLRRRYEDVLSRGCVVVTFDKEAARLYATIRAETGIKGPDAVQLACAAQANVDLFITNDDRLARKKIPGVNFIAPLATAAQFL